jgi:hypothetical protein
MAEEHEPANHSPLQLVHGRIDPPPGFGVGGSVGSELLPGLFEQIEDAAPPFDLVEVEASLPQLAEESGFDRPKQRILGRPGRRKPGPSQGGAELELERDQSLSQEMGLVHGGLRLLLGQVASGPLDHDDAFGKAGYDEVQVAAIPLRDRGERDQPPIDAAETHGADRPQDKGRPRPGQPRLLRRPGLPAGRLGRFRFEDEAVDETGLPMIDEHASRPPLTDALAACRASKMPADRTS